MFKRNLVATPFVLILVRMISLLGLNGRALAWLRLPVPARARIK